MNTKQQTWPVYLKGIDVHGPVQENECWRTRTNKLVKVVLQGEGAVKFIKSLQENVVMWKECKIKE